MHWDLWSWKGYSDRSISLDLIANKMKDWFTEKEDFNSIGEDIQLDGKLLFDHTSIRRRILSLQID
jgi:hypothetical protein